MGICIPGKMILVLIHCRLLIKWLNHHSLTKPASTTQRPFQFGYGPHSDYEPAIQQLGDTAIMAQVTVPKFEKANQALLDPV